jgi:hypothetical protein|tara:strand:+ start:2637 stop:2879 length:243 start_codon:yes stop_codon:yes gene_type:complete
VLRLESPEGGSTPCADPSERASGRADSARADSARADSTLRSIWAAIRFEAIRTVRTIGLVDASFSDESTEALERVEDGGF